MIAAFFLLVIEFVGSSVFGLLRSKSHAIFLNSRAGKNSLELTAKQQATVVVPETRNSEDDCIVEEIQIAESESEVEETETIRREIEQQQHSRRGRIKRHLIKKLVPKIKKLRHGKKKMSENDDRCVWEPGETHNKIEEEIEEDCEQVSWSGRHGLSMIVIVVVAGVVVGGRGFALLVTLVWFLMVTCIGRFLRC